MTFFGSAGGLGTILSDVHRDEVVTPLPDSRAIPVSPAWPAPKQKAGRPLKHPGEGKRPTLTFRCRSRLHARLRAAAAAEERSISEVIEDRLMRSFEGDDLVDRVADAVITRIAASPKPEWHRPVIKPQ